MIELCLLGATGSIGSQVLDLIREKRDVYRLAAFSFGHNINKALEIVEEFEPDLVCAVEELDANRIKSEFPKVDVAFGNKGLQQVATHNCLCPKVINALVGSVGLTPTLSAIEVGRDVYLANKETLVIGGEIVMAKAKEFGVKIIPIDSEHSAIFQLLNGNDIEDVNRIIITASGGSFRDLPREDLIKVTKEDALNHPNWEMGAKITIDSATMMNKGFELIEAHYLFNLPMSKISYILHRESIIHSLVEFNDGSMFAQMATSDMRLPIKYALEYPSHSYTEMVEKLDLVKVGCLHFEELSLERYPMLGYAIEAINKGSVYPTILNAANEVAVGLFLEEKISFLDIEKIVKEALNNPIFDKFALGDLTIPKIMSVDELVRIQILTKYR
ncbi:MAG: 1-deoxy-D-xylulose-5-phosphate reductoisomerase [Bacilli bacterium]|nr:1-deoxy-D-xylulose-5-phosphate reductoisomerase [Bacilli bacterium]